MAKPLWAVPCTSVLPSCRLGDQAIADIQVTIAYKLHRYPHLTMALAMPACLGHHAVGLQKSLDALQPLNLLYIGGQQREARVL